MRKPINEPRLSLKTTQTALRRIDGLSQMGNSSCHHDALPVGQSDASPFIAKTEGIAGNLPAFRAISLSDRSWVEEVTGQHAPYSDFNFTSNFAWDRRISELNGNLVFLFVDYISGKPSLSFLGSRDVERTARELLQAAPALGVTPVLSAIGEELALALRDDGLLVEEDAGNSDYVYSVVEHSELRGRKYRELRQLANRFEREHPDASFEVKDLRVAAVRNQTLDVLAHWTERKEQSDPHCNAENETVALKRLLAAVGSGALANPNLMLSCVMQGDRMLGLGIDEVLPRSYAISHFIKADIAHKGAYEFLNRGIARRLLSREVEYWNWEQDLNIAGLRAVKRGNRPVKFLRKYSVSAPRA